MDENLSMGGNTVETQAPDRQRWGNPLSYKPEWSERAKYAASLVPDNVSVLEIGVGSGVFRELVKGVGPRLLAATCSLSTQNR